MLSHTEDLCRVLSFDVSILLITRPCAPAQLPVPVSKAGLQLKDVQTDINRLIAAIAFRYTDQSCVFLHTDELEAECRAKFSGALDRAFRKADGSRVKFFAYVKAVLNNHVRSQVQRYRFTQKRTGIKPPPKHDRFKADFRSYKPNEVSLDDPDAHLQLGDEQADESNQYVNELAQDILRHCNELQALVFKQLTEPNITALNMATLDARRGKKPTDMWRIHINTRNMAEAVGLEDSLVPEFPYGWAAKLWEKTVLQLQQITLRVRDMKPEAISYDAALATLAGIFGLQIPKSTPPLVVRRLLTLAARDSWQKVNSDVEDLLDKIGAKAPKFNNTSMSCFGVLYQAGHRICESCGLKESCRVQAQNIGLGEITLSPKLLGAKAARTPYILPKPRGGVPVAANIRDMEVIDYLFSNFHRVTHQGELYFRPKEFKDKQKLIFCIGTSTIPLRLRFRNPAPELKKRLKAQGSQHYIPDDMPAEEVIRLINEHTKSVYAAAATTIPA